MHTGRFRGGGLGPKGKELVKAICLSLLDDLPTIEAFFSQDWVATWEGWQELDGKDTDRVAMDLAQRLLRIAGMNVPTRTKSNQERLRELEREGLRLEVAQSHGVNNCLIDSLILGMLHAGLGPKALTVEQRRVLCQECRVHLHDQYGVAHGIYLDAHRDVPPILDYFLRLRWRQDVSVRVRLYDALDHVELGQAAQELDYVDFTWGDRVIYERVELHIYNHKVPCGQGYHFDTLVPCVDAKKRENTEREGAAPKETDQEPLSSFSSSSQTTMSEVQIQMLLQDFFRSRGCAVSIGDRDARDVIAVWFNREALSLKLHTLLQAGAIYADSGWHASNRLVDQWFGYHAARTQGGGRRLGDSGPLKGVGPSGADAMRAGTDEPPGAIHEESKAKQKRGQKRATPGHLDVDAAKKPRWPMEASANDWPRQSTCPPRKRLRGKTKVAGTTFEPPSAFDQDQKPLESDEYLLRVQSANDGNTDPRAHRDKVLANAGACIRPHPCLPAWVNPETPKGACDIPDFFCSFRGCAFEARNYEELVEHLSLQHGALLNPLTAQMYGERSSMNMQTYRNLLWYACQRRAPCAHSAIDRACLRRFREAQFGDNVGASICFLCARRFPYTNGMKRGDRIEWKQIIDIDETSVLGLPMNEVKRTLSYDVYEATYLAQHDGSVQGQIQDQLKDWCSTLQISGDSIKIVCCPEDKVCLRKCPPESICKECRVPVCLYCQQQIARQKKVSSLTLSNDMLVFYPPRHIYAEEITFMEMVCASPCFTAMACFSLEKKLLGDRAMDQDAFMPRQRLVARGNASTFPLAWDTLLQSLQEATREASNGKLQLPRVGPELAEVVNVIIKAGAGTSDASDVAKIIHQARVRRAVVVRLITDAKARGHPAYTKLCIQAMRTRAERLPEDGVPSEIVALLPHDDHLENVQCQKAATPTRSMLTLEETAAELAYMCKPNAIVSERTTSGCSDVNAQHVAMLQSVAGKKAGKDDVEKSTVIYTGNRLLDQFEPWYFAFAFAFLFPYGTGMPDPPAWSAKGRFRRPDGVPRVEFESWMRCMARRCEAQLNRDWTFGFATWNLFFRAAINLSPSFCRFDAPIYDEAAAAFRALTAPDIEAGAAQLVRALAGTYSDLHGKPRAVQGDVTKLRYVRNLRPAARKLLQHMKGTAKALPGTQEARRQMRFEIGAMRVRYGVPLFITVSPDEAHQWLFVRMARTRVSDPVRAASPAQEWICGDRDFPPLDGDLHVPIHIERLRRAFPERVDAAMRQADSLWAAAVQDAQRTVPRTSYDTLDPETVQRATKNRPKEPQQPAHVKEQAARTAFSEMCRVDKVRAWTEGLQTHPYCNRKQQAFCEKIGARVLEELLEQNRSTSGSPPSTPLRWVLHGGPGTGKSHVINLLRKELFEQVLGWEHSVHFQIVSFQAVMANLLDGDTIHHAFGLDWKGHKDRNSQRSWERLRQTLQWRWLILDEFSMVSAELFAQLELACRELMRDLGWAKYGPSGRDIEPFGGLNVIVVGDIYQLPPPKGTFLGDVPWDLVAGRQVRKNASAYHGQTLLWGEPAAGMQGITELQQCERTQDVWLSELQDQLRSGQLSNNNHAFLHGKPTTVPGSWTKGQLECNSKTCAALVASGASPAEILAQECAACKADRCSRRLVAQDDKDPRFLGEFRDSIAIFSTNDLKYHVNKRRAVAWASSRRQQLQIAVAQDIASAPVLQEKPDLAAEKMQWLQRHDKECGGLYGILPLCVGMPVRATDHLDRKRGILKGCKGTVVGWSACSNESKQDGTVIWNQLPQIVFVRFDTGASWHIEGIPETNVFPVTLQKHAWFLDHQRKQPKLRIWRKQFPLAPGFAITAHVAQGQTIAEGVIADLRLGYGANPFTAFVAVTRVKGRNHLLIFRPFDAAPFQKGVGLGRELLVRHLRQEPIDWKALLAGLCEERPCATCAERKNSTAYTNGQWKRSDADRVCRECCKRHAAEGCPWQCHCCKMWHPEQNFPAKHRQRQCSFYRVCLTCESRKLCYCCGQKKPEKAFGTLAWKARHTERRICLLCAKKQRGHWTCTTCKQTLPVSSFDAAATRNGKQRCKHCVALACALRCAAAANHRLRRTRVRVTAAKNARILAEVRREIAQRRANRPPTRAASAAGTRAVDAEAARPQISTEEDASQRRADVRTAHSRSMRPESPGPENLPRMQTHGIQVTDRKRPVNEAAPKQDSEHALLVSKRPKTSTGEQRDKQLFEYLCPGCGGCVASTVRTGQVDHRRHCGARFRVKDGRAVAKTYMYTCPFCNGQVASNTETGRIDHRSVCNNQFYVKDGSVSKQARPHAHSCPVCRTVVWSSRASGLIDIEHRTPAGKVCANRKWHVHGTL
eukprot:Skav231714  [mRNA]  locus=scaffold1306:362022:371836:+ [translate_table: standard]